MKKKSMRNKSIQNILTLMLIIMRTRLLRTESAF